jgi:hypothetical protein
VVVTVNECTLVLVNNGNVGLKSFDYFSEKAVFLNNILFELAVDGFKTEFVV